MAIDQRQKNAKWNVLRSDGTPWLGSYDHSQLAVLMDIRDELQTLNRLLGCSNFIAVPSILRGIRAKIPTRKRRARRT